LTVLVTGANGFIGRYLVKPLAKKGHSVLASGKNHGDKIYFDTLNVPFLKLDVTQKEEFTQLPENINSVVHLAARVPKAALIAPAKESIIINGLGTLNVLEWCLLRGIKKVVYASTQMVIGVPNYLPVDENHPVSPQGHYGNYAISKFLGELFCERFRRDFKIKCVSLRFSGVYGCGENPGFVLTKFIELAEAGKEITIYGAGSTQRDLLYVKDAVAAIIAALDSDCEGIYNIGSGQGTSIKEMAEVISQVFSGGKTPLKHDYSHPEDEVSFYFDTSKAKRDLGFEPKYPLEAGMADYKAEKETAAGQAA